MSLETTGEIRFLQLADGWTVGQMPFLHALPSIRHLVSTRIGPDGAGVGWDDPHGAVNRRRLARLVGAEQAAAVRQVHGNRVVEADEALADCVQADALMTARPGVALLGQSADCPIVLVADVARGAVGMAHASWRGTVGCVAAELIDAMCRAYRCRTYDMAAGICPSAGPCCYEVRDDTVSAARAGLGPRAEGYFLRRQGRTYFDLWRANIEQLTRAGLSEHNIAVAGVCTICDRRFFSYRREGESTGRFAGVIARS